MIRRIIDIICAWLIAVIIALLITGCTPQKKLSYLLDKHPELIRDSITIKDIEIPVPAAADTLVIPMIRLQQPDTFVVENKRSSAKLITQDNKAELITTAKPDTFYIKDTIDHYIIQPPEIIEQKTPWHSYGLCIFIGVLISWIISLLISKLKYDLHRI